jgi:hypothetical protein
MATPKLKLGNDKWATKSKSLLAFNDEGNNFKSLPFNVERLSGASYKGRNGLVQYAATEEPRIDFTNYSKGGLLLEPQRTNIITQSQELSSGSLVKVNLTVTDNTSIVDPQGNTNTKTLTATNNNQPRLEWRGTSVPGSNTSYAMSFWVRYNTARYVAIAHFSQTGEYAIFDLVDGEVENDVGTQTAKIEAYPNGWYRVSKSFEVPSTASINYWKFTLCTQTNPFVGVSGEKADVFGLQFEVGDYSTSYIPTAGSTATRIKDVVIDGGNEYVINNTAGTLFLDCELAARGTSSVYSRVMICRNNETGTRIILDDFGGNWRAVLYSGGTDAAPTIVASSANTRIKLAITYDNTGVKYSYNGTDAVFTSGPFGPTTTMNKIKFSNAAENGSFFNGWVNDFQYFDEVLTDAELKTLTT